MSKPKYTHDCDRCIFLGSFQDGANYDLYVHVDQEHPVLTTVIARWGSERLQYSSGLKSHPALVEAEKRAVDKGILPGLSLSEEEREAKRKELEAWKGRQHIRHELAHMIDVLTGRATYTAESLIGTKETALLLHVSEATIKRWNDAGKLPAIRTPGGHRKIRLGDVVKYAVEHPVHQ